MIEYLVRSNESRLRNILTLTPEINQWLEVMAQRQAVSWAKHSEEELAAACEEE